MKNVWHVFGLAVTPTVVVLLFASFYSNQEAEQAPVVSTPPESIRTGMLPQVITSLDLTRKYDFAGEVVPPDNFDALERLDRELSINSYWHANTLINLKTSARFFPVIEKILAKHGVPDDFKYLAVAESNLRNETSPAGAKGYWQFVESTGKYYGLEITDEIDERLHLEKSTEAACLYLKDYYKQFGSWTIAAAAYNVGGPRMKKYLAEQKGHSYYDLNLNSETSRYVFRVIAMKEIMRDPVAYGFYLEDNELYRPLEGKPVQITGPVESWADFAIASGTTYRMLKVYNPWLLTGSLTNKAGKTYEVKVPSANE